MRQSRLGYRLIAVFMVVAGLGTRTFAASAAQQPPGAEQPGGDRDVRSLFKAAEIEILRFRNAREMDANGRGPEEHLQTALRGLQEVEGHSMWGQIGEREQ
eukprot:SAG22_NODE_3698_length_1570_cov_0.910265_1_plen_101_part_00